MRPLTLLQRQRITLSLFFTVAVGAVFTVAAPAFVPWQVVDEKRAQALDQQRRQGKDFHVIEKKNKKNHHASQSSTATTTTDAPSISSQGPLISLLTDHSRPINTGTDTDLNTGTSDQTLSASIQDPSTLTTIKKKRRRRKRKMVNEGWQEFTGRTAREGKERQLLEQQQENTRHPSSLASASASASASSSSADYQNPVKGENSGIEIMWKNKTRA